MKKIILITFMLSLTFSLFAMKKANKNELIVFAAASMTETLNEIKPIFEKENKDVSLIYNFDSSGTLQKQIENGAYCDIFLSAGKKQINTLNEKGFIASKKDLLENKTVLATHKDNPKNIKNFDDFVKRLKEKKIFISIGNSDVPVGQYTLNTFKYYNIDTNAVSSCISYATSVKEVTTQIKNKSVDCGIIYKTDCFSAGLKAIDTATNEMTGGRVIYPISITNNSKNRELSKKFIDFLKDNRCVKIFSNVGFDIID